MPRLSQSKKDKIAEQVLHFLFTRSPEALFTSVISKEIARDEEFTLSLLNDLQKKKLIIEVAKNPQGTDYKKRRRWRLSNEIYKAYAHHQPKQPPSLPLQHQEPKLSPKPPQKSLDDIPHYIG